MTPDTANTGANHTMTTAYATTAPELAGVALILAGSGLCAATSWIGRRRQAIAEARRRHPAYRGQDVQR